MAATHTEGKVGLASGYDSMALWVYREGELLDTLNYPLNYIGDSASFVFDYEIPAELSEYSYKLWGVAGGRKHFEAEACGVVAGDAYLIYGQSNAVAGFSNFDRDAYIRNFGLRNYGADTLDTWHKLLDEYNPNPFIDKQPGNWGQRLGKNIIEQYQVPVAIINGAVGGQIIENLTADPADHFNPETIYGRWLDRVDKAGLRDRIRAILFFQGESNAAAFICDSTHVYKGRFQTMHADWQADFPDFEHAYLFQIEACQEYGFGPFCSLRIQEAQRQLADEIEDLDIMSASAMRQGADSCHYVYPNGHERAGNDIFRLVAHHLYGSPVTDNIYPPNINTAYFSAYDSMVIVIEVRDSGQTLSWHPGFETDFWLERTANDSVASGQIIDNKIVLHLDAPPAAGFTGLSYASHYGSGETPVTNANGIGLLHFKNFPVAGARLLASPVAYLQGAYDSTAGLMRDNLRATGDLPLTEPYTTLGYTHLGGGGESTVQEVLDISGANAIVDWVFLELRDPSDFSVVIATRSALLQRDGDVVDVDGVSPVAFYGLPEGEYYLAVKHRNHLGAMSAMSVSLSVAATVVDLTHDINNAYGGINGIAPLGDGHLGLYSGDFNRNGQLQNTDYAGMVLTLGTAGYVSGDLDLNGQVQNVDVQFHLVPNIGRGQAFGQ